MNPSDQGTGSDSSDDGIPISGGRLPDPPANGDLGTRQPRRQLSPEAEKLISQQAKRFTSEWPDLIPDVRSEAYCRCLQDPDYQVVQHFRHENYRTKLYDQARQRVVTIVGTSRDAITQRHSRRKSKTNSHETQEARAREHNPGLCMDVTAMLEKLTDAERVIAGMLMEGFSWKDIAGQLGVTDHQVRTIREKITLKLKRLLRAYAVQGQ